MYIPDNYDQFVDFEAEQSKDSCLNDKLDDVVSELEKVKETLADAEGEQDPMTYIDKAIEQIDKLIDQI